MRNHLKTMRNEHSFTLEDLAELSGSSKSYIFDLEQGHTNPTLNKAYAIAVVFDVAVTEIWPNDKKVLKEEKITKRFVG